MKERSQLLIGRKPVMEALQEGAEIERVYINKQLHGPVEKEVRKLCVERGVPLIRIDSEALIKFTRDLHQGLVAILSHLSYSDLDGVISSAYDRGKDPFILVLDGVTDVRNLGAIARSAEVFGVDALLLESKGSALINEVAIKTSVGALLRIPVCRVNSLGNAVDMLQQSGLTVYAADLSGNSELSNVPFKGPLALILGAEEKGIRKHLLRKSDRRVLIAQEGITESLNVSVAAGIFLYEISKNRRKQAT